MCYLNVSIINLSNLALNCDTRNDDIRSIRLYIYYLISVLKTYMMLIYYIVFLVLFIFTIPMLVLSYRLPE